MKTYQHFLLYICVLLGTLLSVSSCVVVEADSYDNTHEGNFEALWQIMDEHYCFFDYKKQELGVDWNEVHARYAAQINDKMNEDQLFEVMTNMLAELKDGHVNLSSAFDYGRNWSFYEDYPENYNDSIVSTTYLGHDYRIASGLKYRIFDDNIGYVRCASFAEGIGDGNVSMMLDYLAVCSGLIIDVRNNGGGELTRAHTLASHFLEERTLVGYLTHKTGKGHSDFSTPFAQYLEPALQGIRWQKPVIVLTNRHCYSACNDFVMCMKRCPNVTILGDHTGGGSGMPFNSELPNGWGIRYSAVVTLDANKQHIEFGIAPDIPLQMSGADTDRNRDTYIETARQMLRAK